MSPLGFSRRYLGYSGSAAVPLFNRTPWFMPAVFAWMTMKDGMAARRR